MGFCLFNNVAIAALHARAAHGLSASRWSISTCITATARKPPSGRTRTCSTARPIRCRSIPAPARSSETGVGNIVNAPLSPGDGGEQFREAFLTRILPALNNFGPDILLVSAGFDAHRDDPLAQLQLVEADFAWVTEQMLEAAAKHCGGRLVSTLEGGYDLDALGRSAAAHVQTLMIAAS